MTPPPAATHAPTSNLSLRAAPASRATWTRWLIDFPGWAGLRWLADATTLYLAAAAALLGYNGNSTPRAWIAAAFPLVALLLLHARRGPDDRLQASRLETTTHVLGVVSMAAMVTIAGAAMLGGAGPLGIVVRLWLFSAVYVATARVVLVGLRREIVKRATLATPTLIVGAGIVGERLAKRLTTQPSYGLRPVGFVDANPLRGAAHGLDLPVLGGTADLADAIERTGARHVILAFSNESDRSLVDLAEQCQKLGVGVSLVPRLFDAMNDRATLDHVGGLPLVELRPTDPNGWEFAIKHAIDRTCAAVILLFLAPVMGALALLVRASSPGPILFRQPRIGRDGHEFTMLKFRTMRGDPIVEGEADAGWAAEISGAASSSATAGVSRITRIGRILRKTSLDELPQLLNVLRGDMSLVGPRPERVSYVREFESVVDRYGDRHRVKSGITGWAQVHGLRGQTSIADRVEWDNFYIQNWSLRLDLRILAMTVGEVFRLRG